MKIIIKFVHCPKSRTLFRFIGRRTKTQRSLTQQNQHNIGLLYRSYFLCHVCTFLPYVRSVLTVRVCLHKIHTYTCVCTYLLNAFAYMRAWLYIVFSILYCRQRVSKRGTTTRQESPFFNFQGTGGLRILPVQYTPAHAKSHSHPSSPTLQLPSANKHTQSHMLKIRGPSQEEQFLPCPVPAGKSSFSPVGTRKCYILWRISICVQLYIKY